MDEKIKNLWNTNKLLFWILFPLIAIAVIVFVFRDLVLAILIGSARKTSEDAKRSDEKLKDEKSKAELEAAKSQANADSAQKRIDERKEEDINEDWYKKGK